MKNNIASSQKNVYDSSVFCWQLECLPESGFLKFSEIVLNLCHSLVIFLVCLRYYKSNSNELVLLSFNTFKKEKIAYVV